MGTSLLSSLVIRMTHMLTGDMNECSLARNHLAEDCELAEDRKSMSTRNESENESVGGGGGGRKAGKHLCVATSQLT